MMLGWVKRAASQKGVEAWTQWIENGRRRHAQTPGFARYLAPDPDGN